MERELIVKYMREKRKVVVLTFLLLVFAFIENYYIYCTRIIPVTACTLGWIYVALAGLVVVVAYAYRK